MLFGHRAANRFVTKPGFLQSGSRMLYMSRPSTPAASFARFWPSFAFARRCSLERPACQRGRHDDDAVVVGHDDIARIHQRPCAYDRNVHRAERRFHRALRGDRLAPHRETSSRSARARRARRASMTRPARRAP